MSRDGLGFPFETATGTGWVNPGRLFSVLPFDTTGAGEGFEGAAERLEDEYPVSIRLQTVIPPSTTSTWPVTNAESSESKNLTGPTTSAGVPSRPRGVRRTIL